MPASGADDNADWTHTMIGDETFLTVIHLVTRGIEIVGTAIIVVGALGALIRFGLVISRGLSSGDAVAGFRSELGRAILLGLEFLVAADIINTVAVEPTLGSLAVLGGIVLIRTFLSFSLEVEIEGRWPWQRQNSSPESNARNPTERAE